MANSALTLPNLITLARFFVVPVIVYFMISGQWATAFWLFVLAGLSDAVDGIIARHFNQKTEIGAYLDPVADKVLLVAVFVILAVNHHLPLWLVITVVSRDILIVGAVVLSSIMGTALTIEPIFVSKATTAAQIALAAYAFAAQVWLFDMGFAGQILIYTTAGLTLASAAAYGVVWFRHMAGHGET